ncbi:MAG TPA: ribose 5-phosphate isomerase B [Actinobacteria bacterium]|nr:ribose 5-phosphate isomerase B [Actinomycetota bacterium]
MKVIIGSDHAGYGLKEEIKKFLEERGTKVTDVGTNGLESVDYPDYVEKVACPVAKGDYTRGILVCGAGIGMAMTANKIPGIRAAVCNDLYSARCSRKHNDANILALAARIIDVDLAVEIVDVWLKTKFLGGRHARRVGKIMEVERKYLRKGLGDE